MASALFSGLLVLAFLVSSTTEVKAVEENPWKIKWTDCSEGSAVEQVIRCRTDGAGECFANMQYFCDENPFGE